MDGEDVPASTPFVWGQAERRLEEQISQADALDTKAGVLLGVQAIAAGIGASTLSALGPAAKWIGVAALVGLGLAVWFAFQSFRTQDYDVSPAPEEMWRFASEASEYVQFVFLSTRFRAIEDNRDKLGWKARRLAIGLGITLVVGLMVIVSAIIGVVADMLNL